MQSELAALPPTLRAAAAAFFERFPLTDRLTGYALPHLVRLVACSEFAARVLLRERGWFLDSLADDSLSRAGPGAALARLAAGDALPQPELQRTLRVIRNRQLLAILWREISGQSGIGETLADLSRLADGLIKVAAKQAVISVERRFGNIVNADGRARQFVVLAMGKLGGSELNFSSDVDLIFLYDGDGRSDGGRELSAQEYFGRVARQCVALLEPVTEDGFVYRVDTRLRPFGDSGPPVVSFAALESYLLQHGRSWERYAFVKARMIFGDDRVADDLMSNLIEPFVYRRYLDYGVFESLRKMKHLIEVEVSRRDLANNIKLGPGGIREVEFIVQSLQLVRGGADPALRGPGLRDVVAAVVGHGGLDRRAVESLMAAYYFLRRLENWLQAARDQQTHEYPDGEMERDRAALALGLKDRDALQQKLARHRDCIASSFADVAFRTAGPDGGDSAEDALSERLGALWDAAADADAWADTLRTMQIAAAEPIGKMLAAFAQQASSRQIDSIARRRLIRLLPRLLVLAGARPNPDVVMQRMLGILTKILRRSAYVSLLNENPPALERLLDVCSTSAYLADEISRFPLLLDEMLDPRLYSSIAGKADLARDLATRMARFDEHDSEARITSLCRFQRAALLRIAIADFNGSMPLMHVSDRLTDLAEVVLNAALAAAWQDLVLRHGVPRIVDNGQSRQAGLGVIAYGKLAGMELSYNSDLDLVFLHDSRGREQFTDGARSLENSMFFSRLVRRLVHFLTTQTGSGSLYEVDTRLRPSGRSGLLVSSVEGFERYQEENAWTWEHQALLRSRPVAGSPIVAREFERIRSDTLRHRVRRDGLLDEVKEMRAKMRKHLDTSDTEHFDLKQGQGGIGDIEFLVQYLVLQNAQEHPAVIHYTDNIRQLGTLAAAGCISAADAEQLQAAYQAYRLRLHRLALDQKSSIVDAAEFDAERSSVMRIVRARMGG
ncbi:MAG: bifunctional [glutamate--ammonia ligase]-adenylyl-L-tyrosine phosphorylase/[glutamate--ammonia-ligase] adenylyltransferase [Gammaproteobacteria bacterium]|nr:bifunctional [glutamate--ammonia ligase]-adenylyl-L-tyrosine phosphorylase/[glutamate--ammonia-ligase] adenylyltransferase [Gammaproteobacteria bacterium]